MEKHLEERPPVIVVKKRRTFLLPSLSEKTDIIESAFTEQVAESPPSPPESIHLQSKHISPNRQLGRRKRKDTVSHVPHTGPVSLIPPEYVEKIKPQFPHLRAEGGAPTFHLVVALTYILRVLHTAQKWP